MSRSYKKHPFQKVGGTSKRAKQWANRTIRRTNKVPSGKAYRKFFNSWDIADWITRWTWQDCLREWEKHPDRFPDHITSVRKLKGYYRKNYLGK